MFGKEVPFRQKTLAELIQIRHEIDMAQARMRAQREAQIRLQADLLARNLLQANIQQRAREGQILHTLMHTQPLIEENRNPEILVDSLEGFRL
jgi:hypothetical protein